MGVDDVRSKSGKNRIAGGIQNVQPLKDARRTSQGLLHGFIRPTQAEDLNVESAGKKPVYFP